MAKGIWFQYLGLCVILLDLACGDKVLLINKPLGVNVTMEYGNILSMDVMKIQWTKDGILLFLHSPVLNETKKNFTSVRMSVDPATPAMLHVSDVQVSDEGIYTCNITHKAGIFKTRKWNLTISSGNSASPGPSTLIYISTAAISGMIFIIVVITLCICRMKKKKSSSGSQESGQPNESREGQDYEMSNQRQARRMDRQSSQYFERYNSVYGQF